MDHAYQNGEKIKVWDLVSFDDAGKYSTGVVTKLDCNHVYVNYNTYGGITIKLSPYRLKKIHQ